MTALGIPLGSYHVLPVVASSAIQCFQEFISLMLNKKNSHFHLTIYIFILPVLSWWSVWDAGASFCAAVERYYNNSKTFTNYTNRMWMTCNWWEC